MTTTLYEQLGADDGIARLVDDIVAAHMENPVINARFRPYQETPERLEQLKGHLRDFLSAGSGGTAAYTGRSMPDSHRGMNISEAEYVAATDDILATLDSHGVEPEARRQVLEIAWSLKDEIVHV
ncbi:MAG: group 1 truncated hemoglobin [Deinococcus-Thermus bacterium]|jgi:hemoglobin|nr:group 1 truncated hemoglobin [Deinococcota bacterium]